MSDEKHEGFRRLGSVLIEKNLKVFQPLLVLFKLRTQQQILSTCFIFSNRFHLITQTLSRSLNKMDKRNLFYTSSIEYKSHSN